VGALKVFILMSYDPCENTYIKSESYLPH